MGRKVPTRRGDRFRAEPRAGLAFGECCRIAWFVEWHKAGDGRLSITHNLPSREEPGMKIVQLTKAAVVRKNSVRAPQGRLSGFLYQAILVM